MATSVAWNTSVTFPQHPVPQSARRFINLPAQQQREVDRIRVTLLQVFRQDSRTSALHGLLVTYSSAYSLAGFARLSIQDLDSEYKRDEHARRLALDRSMVEMPFSTADVNQWIHLLVIIFGLVDIVEAFASPSPLNAAPTQGHGDGLHLPTRSVWRVSFAHCPDIWGWCLAFTVVTVVVAIQLS